MRSALFATAMTWRPRPLPSEAPSMIPGKSSSCFGRCQRPHTRPRAAHGTRLNLRVAVVDDAGNTGQRGELVRRL